MHRHRSRQKKTSASYPFPALGDDHRRSGQRSLSSDVAMGLVFGVVALLAIAALVALNDGLASLFHAIRGLFGSVKSGW